MPSYISTSGSASTSTSTFAYLLQLLLLLQLLPVHPRNLPQCPVPSPQSQVPSHGRGGKHKYRYRNGKKPARICGPSITSCWVEVGLQTVKTKPAREDVSRPQKVKSPCAVLPVTSYYCPQYLTRAKTKARQFEDLMSSSHALKFSQTDNFCLFYFLVLGYISYTTSTAN